MLKKRVIPVVLIDGFSVIKTIKFNVRRNLGSPITVMRTYNTRNVDEMIILDIDASKQSRSIDKFIIQEITSDCFMPLTVGGGVCNLTDIEDLLKSGADKVSINTRALQDINFIDKAASVFGSQCIVGSVDIIKASGDYRIYQGGKVIFDKTIQQHIHELVESGVGELLITNVDRDGTMEGLDLDIDFLNELSVPVIFSGGTNGPHDAFAAFSNLGVDALGVSSLFHFTSTTPNEISKFVNNLGIPARF